MNHILTEFDGPLAIVTLNNPDKHNAFDDTLITDLTGALRAIDQMPEVRVLILSASGKSFSAGADLNWMKRIAAYTEDENFRDAMALGDLMRVLHELSKPTIARVQGAAFGGGVGLIACCDMAVGTHEAAFSLSEVKLGLIPAVISPYVIAAIGERAAHRYFLTAEKFDASEAYRLGLLSELCTSEDDMDERIESLIASLLSASPAAIDQAKQLIGAVANRPLSGELVADTAKRIARMRVSEHGQEGLAAFLDKRKPLWSTNLPE